MEKKEIKISLGTLICIIIIVLLIIALFVMWNHFTKKLELNNTITTNTNNLFTTVDQEELPTTNNQITENNELELPIEGNQVTETKTINKVYQDKELVYSLYNQFASEYSYSIPYININSPEASQINKEIEEYYKPLMEQSMKNEQENLAVPAVKIKYYSYLNNNILSLLIVDVNNVDASSYKVYNLDVYIGKQITNLDIINAKNITETKLLNSLKTAYKEKFEELYGEMNDTINSYDNHPYKTQLDKTISSDNYSIETPIFLNENGKICAVAEIHSLAGALSYYHIVNTDI